MKPQDENDRHRSGAMPRDPFVGTRPVGSVGENNKQESAAGASSGSASDDGNLDVVARVRVVANARDDAAALALLEDDAFLALLDRALAHRQDVVRKQFFRLGIHKASVDGALARYRQRTAPPPPAAEMDHGDSDPAAPDPAELNRAKDLLRDPQLLARFRESVKRGGLVGEEHNATALLLAAVTRRTGHPIHVVVKGASAAGKNRIVRAVTEHLPEHDVKEIGDMSPRALQYFDGDGLAGKVAVLVEQDAGERAAYPLRVTMSEGSFTTIVAEKDADGRIVSREHTVSVGCIFSTTTRATLHNENETRVLELTVDDSEEQTRRINGAVAARAAHPPTAEQAAARTTEVALWRMAINLLEPVEVVVPQATKMCEGFPSRQIRARRDFKRLLDLISASALLHQFQRERDGERVVASDKDVEIGSGVAEGLRSRVLPRLRQLRDKLRTLFGNGTFSTTQAATKLGADQGATLRDLRAMQEAGLVDGVEEGKGRRPHVWQLLPEEEP